jgi:thiol:disulfide interchange protein DsbD
MRSFSSLLAALLAGVFLSPLRAQDDLPFGSLDEAVVPVTASVVAEVKEIAPGEPFRVALKLDHAPHWHTYYLNPGQVGFPPSLEWELPDGFTASELEFPVPIVGTFAGAPFYGYEGETWFLQTITPPATLKPGDTVTLSGEASWLACEIKCVPGDATLELTLPVAAAASPEPASAAAFAAADAAMPKLPTAWKAEASEGSDGITLTLTPGAGAVEALEKVHFFSRDSIEDASKPQALTREGDAWKLLIPRNPETDPKPATINGILRSDSGWLAGNPSKGLALDQLAIVSGGADAGAAGGPPRGEGASSGLLLTFALMFIGGLILNLMPCVFPVIGLKIMGFVQQSGQDRSKVAKHGLVFTGGVLVSFWVLCALLLAGGIRNWGGQLQNPWVVLSLLLVMLIFGLSMYGVFEIGSSATGVGGKLANKDGLSGSFFSGVLATVVATPCSAPFLGTGLSATVALPTPLFITSFTFMALGLSLPYLLLSFFPSLVEKLPRPGPWMESFKQGMAFLLFGTVGFLTWLYLKQVGDQLDGQKALFVLVGLSVVAAGFWIYGRWVLPYRSVKARVLGRAFAAVFLIAGFVMMKPSPAAKFWQEWSKEKQEALLKEGKSVYVDFTAAWCVTCQTNKAAAYTDETIQLFKAHGIVPLKADKTSDVPAIDEELKRLGEVAIPVNVLYVQGNPEPRLTQPILTAGYLQDFIRQHLGEPPSK